MQASKIGEASERAARGVEGPCRSSFGQQNANNEPRNRGGSGLARKQAGERASVPLAACPDGSPSPVCSKRRVILGFGVAFALHVGALDAAQQRGEDPTRNQERRHGECRKHAEERVHVAGGEAVDQQDRRPL